MADEGMRFTDFYAQTVCGPSRAALMTGSYPLRVATKGNRVDVHPYLHSNEITIAEVLKPIGYTTAAFGKWDLAGHTQDPRRYARELMPLHQGFDYFFGTPTSNDSKVNLIRNQTIIEMEADMSQLTRRYTDEAIGFIKRSKDQPFFVYLAHTMPHIRLERSEQFEGKSMGGIYGDVIEEIDWNVGRILQTLKDEGLDASTYVIYTSDNGPWYLGRSKGHLNRLGPKLKPMADRRSPCGAPRHPPGKAGCACLASCGRQERFRPVPFAMKLPRPWICFQPWQSLPEDRSHETASLTATTFPISSMASRVRPARLKPSSTINAPNSKRFGPEIGNCTSRDPPIRCGATTARPKTTSIFRNPCSSTWKPTYPNPTISPHQHPSVVKDLLELAEHAREDIGDVDRIGTNARFFDDDPKRPDITK